MWNEKRLCSVTGQNAFDFFVQNDDGHGRERGELVSSILLRLERRDKPHQARWDRIWAEPFCQKYRRPEHEDHWIWNADFYNAPVEDLRRIAALVVSGARRRGT